MSRQMRMLSAAAIGWSALLFPLAVVFPAESSPSIYSTSGAVRYFPKVPLVRVNGYRVLLLVTIPLLISLLATLLIMLNLATGRWLAGSLAWVLSVGILTAGVVGAVTILIGVFVVPTGVLLVAACAQSRKPSQSTGRPQVGIRDSLGPCPPGSGDDHCGNRHEWSRLSPAAFAVVRAAAGPVRSRSEARPIMYSLSSRILFAPTRWDR
jgi:hypothetical protein